MAVERILGEPPAKLALYFLQPGIEHVVQWNSDARQSAIEQLNEAIASTTDWSLQ
jgi:hypothetical protein